MVLLLYVLGRSLAWATINASDLGTLLFPSAGLTFSAFLVVPQRQWPTIGAAVVVGEWVAGVTAGGSDHHLSLIGFGVANLLGPMTAALLVGWLTGRPSGRSTLPFLGRRFFAIFVAAGIVAGPLVSATIGSIVAQLAFGTEVTTLLPQWWLGDALGVIVIAPLLLLFFPVDNRRPLRSVPSMVLVVLSWISAFATVALSDLPLLFLPLTLMLAVGVVGGGGFVAIAGGVIALVVSVTLANDPSGLIASLSPSTALMITKLEFLVFAVTAYGVTAEANERVVAARSAAREHVTVAELQRLLLPPPSMSGRGFSAVGRYEAAERRIGVGGDWYLIRQTLDGRLAFGVGDIVGHDIDAARAVAAVRSGLVLEAALDPSPLRLLERLDDFAAAETSIRYGTAWMAVFDPATRWLEYASAGHLPPLLVTADKTEFLESPQGALVGLPLGGRAMARVQVPDDATVVLYTDGLVERRGEQIDVGLERLLRVVEEHGCQPDAVLQTLLASGQRDDDTILAMIELSTRHHPARSTVGTTGAADTADV